MSRRISNLIVFYVLLIFLGSISAALGWSVKVTWTVSAGPDLAKEVCLVESDVKCTVIPPAVTECSFLIDDLAGQEVTIRSYNTQGAFVNYVVGNLNQAHVNRMPDGAIDTPAVNITIDVGDSVDFSGTGTDPDGNVPLTFLWDFGDPSIADSTAEDPGLIQFNNSGVFVISFMVTDALGLSDPTPATQTVTVMVGGGGPSISKSGWSLLYVDSEETVAANYAAVNAFDGDLASFWHTEYSPSIDPPPPHEIQIDLGDVYDIDGFRYLPRQDINWNGRINQYEFYVSADGINWGTAVAVGSFANDMTEKEVLFSIVTGRYVRLVALSEVNGNAWTSMAELGVLGNLNPVPAPATDGSIIISQVEGGSLTLAWDANIEPDLAGYKIYYGIATGDYLQSVDVGNATQYTLKGLVKGKMYYFAVTAYDDSDNESSYSEEIRAEPGAQPCAYYDNGDPIPCDQPA